PGGAGRLAAGGDQGRAAGLAVGAGLDPGRLAPPAGVPGNAGRPVPRGVRVTDVEALTQRVLALEDAFRTLASVAKALIGQETAAPLRREQLGRLTEAVEAASRRLPPP